MLIAKVLVAEAVNVDFAMEEGCCIFQQKQTTFVRIVKNEGMANVNVVMELENVLHAMVQAQNKNLLSFKKKKKKKD